MSARLAAIAAIAAALFPAPVLAAGSTLPAQPNVIFILTDDQSLGMFSPRTMPRTHRLLVDRGTEFKQFVVPTPLCCPSRAAFATGQYGHNNGVLRNFYSALKGNENTLPEWMRRAGYRTAHVGRFYNGYESPARTDEVAPGWNIWRTALHPRGYFDYTMATNDGLETYGKTDGEHLTVTLNRIAAKIARRETAEGKPPLFLQLDHLAPHVASGDEGGRCADAAVPAPADRNTYLDERLPTVDPFNELDLTDKPAFMRDLPLIEGERLSELERQYRCALASLVEVDRGVEKIHRALAASGALEETVVIFASDNGYEFGEHRIEPVKLYPYEESVRVPFVVRLPQGVPHEKQTRLPAANIDLAPTLLELAGAKPCDRRGCRRLDGRSLVPTLLGRPDIDRDRAIALELEVPASPEGLVCTYNGLRSKRFTYVEHTMARASEAEPCGPVAETELYDRATDPFQLQNLTPSAPYDEGAVPVPPELLLRQDKLALCSGIKGRDPRRDGVPFCE